MPTVEELVAQDAAATGLKPLTPPAAPPAAPDPTQALLDSVVQPSGTFAARPPSVAELVHRDAAATGLKAVPPTVAQLVHQDAASTGLKAVPAAPSGAGYPTGAGNLRSVAAQAAQRHGVPVPLFLAQIQQESGFRRNAVSPAGAQGIAQFMPATARGMGLRDPFNAEEALDKAAELMAQHFKTYGKWDLALAAYNGGPRAVKNGRVWHVPETQNYVATIMGAMKRQPASTAAHYGVTYGPPVASPPPLPQKFGTRAEEGIPAHGGLVKPGLPPIGAVPANRAAETFPRPGELRQESPAEFAQRSQQAAAQPVDSVSAGFRKAAPVLEFAAGAFPNMHEVLQRGARPGQNQQLADQELATAFVKDVILNRVAGAVGKAAEGRLVLTKIGQRWLAQQALAAPVRAAIMRVLNPARLGGEAAVGAVYQGALDASKDLTPQERAGRLVQGAAGQMLLGTALHVPGEVRGAGRAIRAERASGAEALRQYEASGRAPQEGHVTPAPPGLESPYTRGEPTTIGRQPSTTPRFTPGETVEHPSLPGQPLRVIAQRGGKVQLAGPNGRRITAPVEQVQPVAGPTVHEQGLAAEEALRHQSLAEPPAGTTAPRPAPPEEVLPGVVQKTGGELYPTANGPKHLWELTAAEYQSAATPLRNRFLNMWKRDNPEPDFAGATTVTGKLKGKTALEKWYNRRDKALTEFTEGAREQEVSNALNQGLRVPPEVLADFPHLRPSTEPATPPEAPAPPVAPAEPQKAPTAEAGRPAGTPEPAPSEPAPRPRTTGLANQVTELETAAGLYSEPEKLGTLPSVDALQRQGEQRVRDGADYHTLAAEIGQGRRAPTPEETSVLLAGKARLLNTTNAAWKAASEAAGTAEHPRLLAAAEDAQARLNEYVGHVEKGKGWSSQGLRAWQMGTDLDTGNPAQVLERAQARKGSPLTPVETEAFRKQSETLAELQTQHAKLQAAHEALKAEHAKAAEAATRTQETSNTSPRTVRLKQLKTEEAQILAHMAKITKEATSRLSSGPGVVYDAGRYAYSAGKLAINKIRQGSPTLDQAILDVQEEFQKLGVALTREHVISDIWTLTQPNRKLRPPTSKATSQIAEAVREAGGHGPANEPANTLRRQQRSAATAEARASRKAGLEAGAEPARTINRITRSRANEPANTINRRQATIERYKERIAALESGAPAAARIPKAKDAELSSLRKRVGELERESRNQGMEPGRTINRGIKARASAQQRAEATLAELDRKLRDGDLTPLSTAARRDPTLAERELRGQIANRKAELQARIDAMAPTTRQQRLVTNLGEIANLPRTLSTTADISAPGRQGIIFSLSHPVESGRAFGAQLRSFASPTAHAQLAAQIAGRENAVSGLDRAAKLYLAPMTEAQMIHGGLSAREEGYVSRILQRVPGVRHVVGGSERAYTAFLNSQRAQRFDALAGMLKRDGYNPDTKEGLLAYQRAAEYVNAATGRGSLGDLGPKAQAIASQLLFSPRFQASRVQVMGKWFNAIAAGGRGMPPALRREAALDALKFTAAGLAILGAAKAGGAEVETDPRSADFGRIKIGNTRYDIWGGMQPYVRLVTGLLSAQRKDQTGRLKPADGAAEQLGRFAQGKSAPIPGFVLDVLSRKDFTGAPVVTPSQIGLDAARRMLPMVGTDLYEALTQDHQLANELLAGPASAVGLGVQTYTPNQPKARAHKPGSEPSWSKTPRWAR